MDEINLKELFEFFKEKVGTLIIITVAVCMLGCIYGLIFQTPLYRSYTTVVLGGNESVTSGITQNDININKNLVNSYAEIVASRRVLSQVIDELDLDMSYDQLRGRVNVTAVNNTEIIKITVSDVDPIEAKNIANITANVFSKEVAELYNINNVNILDTAFEASAPYNINVSKQFVVYLMVGFVLGACILFIIFYFDRTIKTAEQVEQKIKLPILGSVQMLNKGGKQ